jgi:Uma2 family endonuclease
MATLNSQTLDPKYPPRGLRMTEEEFVQWCRREGIRKAEWVNGEVILEMAPISFEHDQLQSWLRAILEIYARRKDLGRVLGPEFTSRLTLPGAAVLRREPDVMFVMKSRLNLLQKNHLEGPPDLAIEIVSPESESRDWREKYLEYEGAGVREYWIVEPMSERVEAYTLKGGRYQIMPEQEGKIPSSVVPSLYVKPAWLWQEELPDVLVILKELGIE